MKPICMIKSHSKGIILVLDREAEFEKLVLEVCSLFARSKDFFKQGDMVLSIEGRILEPEELLVVIEAIELNSEVKIAFVMEQGELRDARTVGKLDKFFYENIDSNAKIIHGNIKTKERVVSDTGLLIIGDVKKNAKVEAAGSVYVMGTLEGDVSAGINGHKNAVIVAGNLLAKEATICGVKGNIRVKYRGLCKIKSKKEPIVIRLLHGRFEAEPLSGGLLIQEN